MMPLKTLLRTNYCDMPTAGNPNKKMPGGTASGTTGGHGPAAFKYGADDMSAPLLSETEPHIDSPKKDKVSRVDIPWFLLVCAHVILAVISRIPISSQEYVPSTCSISFPHTATVISTPLHHAGIYVGTLIEAYSHGIRAR
jgi:hypothetical protein